jgi:gluconolactonase
MIKRIWVVVILGCGLAIGAEPVKVLDTGAGEGPAWNPKLGLLFSGGDKITRLNLEGKIEVYRAPSGGSNGLLWDAEGRLVVCEAANRRVTRIEKDGSVTILADHYEGKRFNSPNDLTVDSHGRIYFSDPRYGPREGMEILDAAGKAVEGVYRIDAPGKVTRVITHEADRPNGLLVSKDDRYLYVADNNNNTAGGARKLWRFKLGKDGSVDLKSRKLLFDWETSRGPDGLKRDEKGRLYVAGGLNKANQFESPVKYQGGVFVLSPEGKLLRFVAIPKDEVTNVAFGGKDWKTLFITAGGTLWSLEVDVAGEAPLRRR